MAIFSDYFYGNFPVRYVSHDQRVDDIETLRTINIGTEKSTNITSIPGEAMDSQWILHVKQFASVCIFILPSGNLLHSY